MKQTFQYPIFWTILVACACAGGVASAKTCVWTGASSALWTDAGNWEGGTIPGRYKVSSSVEGDWGDEAVFTDCSGATTIDLTGLNSIACITVRGANAPKFTFGTSNAQTLPLEALTANTNAIRVSEEVPQAPEFAAYVEFGWHEDVEISRGASIVVSNDSPTALKFGKLGESGWIDRVNGGNAASRNLYFSGKGPIEIAGPWKVNNVYYSDGYSWMFSNTAGVTFTGDIAIGGVLKATAGARIKIAEGATVTAIKSDKPNNSLLNRMRLQFNVPITIEGPGTLCLRHTEFSQCSVGVGKFLTFDCKVAFDGSERLEGEGWTLCGSGNWAFNNLGNTIAGPLYWVGSDTTGAIQSPKFGKIGEVSPFYNVDRIVVGNYGELIFVGSEPDETDRTLEIGKVSTYANNSASLLVSQNGSGTFTVDSPLEINTAVVNPVGGYYTLTIGGTGTANGIWKHVLAEPSGRQLQVKKVGSARWVLSAANTYTGPTTLGAGTLALSETGSIAAASPLVFTGGALEIAPGTTRTLGAATATAGNSRLVVGAGASLTLASLSISSSNGATLDIRLGAGATFVNTAAVGSTGMTPLPGLKLNGGDAFFNAEGRLEATCGALTQTIPVKGGVVPDDATARVGVVAGGTSGPLSLEVPVRTSVEALTLIAPEDGQLDLQSGTLATRELNSASTAGNFLVANGTVAPIGGTGPLTLTVDPPDATQTIHASLDAAFAGVTKNGAGRAILTRASDIGGAVTVNGGELAFLTNPPAATLTGAVTGSGRFVVAGSVENPATANLGALTVVTAQGAEGTSELLLKNIADGTLSANCVLSVGSSTNESTSKPSAVSRMRMVNARLSSGWAAGSDAVQIYVGRGYGTGVLSLEGDSLLGFAPVVAGLNGYGRGALYQEGGSIAFANTTWSGHMWVGSDRSWGYYRLAAGSLDAPSGNVTVGGSYRASGVFHQLGGEISFNQIRNTAGNATGILAGYGLVRHSGGTASGWQYACPKSDAYSINTHGVLVVDGGDITFSSVMLLNGTKQNRAYVALNSGSLTAPRFSIANIEGLFGDETIYYGLKGEDNKAFLAFDGGTFREKDTGNQNFVDPRDGFERATVYAGGAVFDVPEGSVLTLNQRLDAPTGRGLASVTWTGYPGVAEDGFVGPPAVRIVGDGEGAVAAASFDKATGRITGIEVLSPGFGYTWAQAEVRYSAGPESAVRPCAITNACELTQTTPASGLIVKHGVGTLAIASTNTVAGISLVEGVVRLAAEDAFPNGLQVEFNGGSLETASGVSMPPITLALAVGETKTCRGRFDFPEGSSVTIRGLDLLGTQDTRYTLAVFPDGHTGKLVAADELPERWKLIDSGTSIRLVPSMGLAIFIR